MNIAAMQRMILTTAARQQLQQPERCFTSGLTDASQRLEAAKPKWAAMVAKPDGAEAPAWIQPSREVDPRLSKET